VPGVCRLCHGFTKTTNGTGSKQLAQPSSTN
jgi:hypothetical protein